MLTVLEMERKRHRIAVVADQGRVRLVIGQGHRRTRIDPDGDHGFVRVRLSADDSRRLGQALIDAAEIVAAVRPEPATEPEPAEEGVLARWYREHGHAGRGR